MEDKEKKHWYNNGEVQVCTTECPEGFVPGMLPWTKEHIEKLKIKNQERAKSTPVWNKGKKGVQKAWNKGIPMSEEAKKKRSETWKKKYPNGRPTWNKGLKFPGKTSSSTWTKGNIPWNKGLPTSEETKEKIRQALQGRKLTEEQKEQFNEKSYITKKKNRSFKSSSVENTYYKELKKYFSNEDISREYKDSRYPFKCDFYIKSKDLFIELNIFPTHGGHPFDISSTEDLNEVDRLLNLPQIKISKSTGKEYSSFAAVKLYIWTEYDVLKLKTLKNNNLNYRIYYSLEEALTDLQFL